jgi:hypothetical protein
MNYHRAAEIVFNEYANSVERHGTWADYTIEQMMSVIIHELMVEAGGAEQIGDIHGDHGVIRELAQVAACCMKAIMVLVDRHKETLAETLRPAGAHSGLEGCVLPASPTLHQDKKACSNHPEGKDI